MTASENEIIDFLKSKADAAWQDEQPYLLSLAGPDLEKNGIDYRAILQGERLKAFVERTEGDERYRLVKHPHQKARIGLVKHDVKFEFEINDNASHTRPSNKIHQAQGSVLLDFLNALAKLPLEDINDVAIPTRVLVKLSKKR